MENSSLNPQPPKRQKLPSHVQLLNQQQQLPLIPPSTQSLTFNQLHPPTSNTSPFLTPSLFSTLNQNTSVLNSCGDVSFSLSSNFHEDVWRTRSSVPLGPFTGYAAILSRSRFLKPAQDLLDELCYYSIHQNIHDDDDSGMDLIHNDVNNSRAWVSCKESSLILLLDEVFKRCQQYYQHLESVVASFEVVCGLENAAPYVSFALKTMAQRFNRLKRTLLERARIAGEAMSCMNARNVASGCQDPHTRCDNLKPDQTTHTIQHPVWRSQRGLPAYAVGVLKNWLFEHFLHPYPSDTDKNLLAQQTGLSRNQVSNWFINARVRLWKPMVDEIHTLDEQRAQPATKIDVTSNANVQQQPPETMQMSLDKLHEDRVNRRYPASSNENMDLSLALGVQQNDVPGNADPYNNVNM